MFIQEQKLMDSSCKDSVRFAFNKVLMHASMINFVHW